MKKITGQDVGSYDGALKGNQVSVRVDAREALRAVARVLQDIAEIKQAIILPELGEELNICMAHIASAYMTRKPIQLFTPFCPDWSRDAKGRYDFKSLGGDASFIARKVFSDAPALLHIFQKNKIPYEGVLVFANWGTETEIQAKDTYGQVLSREDIQTCFASTHAKTDEELLGRQKDPEIGVLFTPYRIIPMTEFFQEQGSDPSSIFADAVAFFKTDKKGRQLVDQLHKDSMALNASRLQLSPEQNFEQTIKACAEYAVFGHALGLRGMILAAESRTTSRAYNLFRRNQGLEVMPLFYLKGKSGINEGVNIL